VRLAIYIIGCALIIGFAPDVFGWPRLPFFGGLVVGGLIEMGLGFIERDKVHNTPPISTGARRD
jgi:hypothetical protein